MKPEQGSTGRTDITLELIHNALETLADEMSFTVSRTGRSVITKDLYDFSCAIFDPQGQLLVQGAGLPAAIGAMPDAAEAMLRWVGDDLDPGDVVILNDPYDGGTHLPDIFVFRPIFYQDLLVGFSGVYSHHVDIGGRVPGSSAHDSTEIYQEGLRLPPLKLYRRGVADDTVFRIVERNVRAPEMVFGDLRAQVAACYAGEQGFLKLVERYGMEHLKAYTAELLDYTERVARTEIARWPDGDYQFTDYVDDDGMGSDPLPINVTLRVRGDSLTVDFTGTAPQAKSAINATRSWTKGCVYTAVRFAMNTDMPNNHGYFRPIEVITPKGSVVDLQFPAACTARHHVAVRTFDATMGALAKVLKDEVFAACDGQIGIMTLGGWGKDGRPFLHYEACCNAWGGRPTKDGLTDWGTH